MARRIPLVDYLVLGDEPHLVAHECTVVRGPVLRPPQRLRVVLRHGVRRRGRSPPTGELQAFTIVSLAAPGVPVPFVAALVDCDGTSVRGNVVNVEPDPEHVQLGMKVRLATWTSVGTDDGAPRRSASASSRLRRSDAMAERRRLDPRDPHDEVRQAPRQGPGRPRHRGGAGRAGRRRRHDEGHGRARGRQPHGRAAGIGQQLQKQIGQTGIPVYNVANACATGATALRTAIMAIKAGEADIGLAVGVEKLAGAGLLAGGARRQRRATPGHPEGRYGAVAPVDGRIGTETMPGVFAQIGMEYGHRYGGTELRAVRPDHREEPRPLHAQPAGRLPEADEPRRDHERRHDRLPEHPADVLGQLRRRGGRGGGERRQAEDALAGAAAAGGEDRAPRCSPPTRGRRRARSCPNVNTLTRNAAAQAYEQAGVGPEDLDLVELHDCFATAELVHYDNLMLCEEGGAVDFFQLRRHVARRRARRSTCRAGSSPRATRSPPPASPTSGRSPPPARRGRRPPDRGRQGRAWPT